MPTLSDKLKSLGVRVGARDLPPPAQNPLAIERVVPGRLQPTDYGPAFVVETTYAADYRHGRVGLPVTASLKTVAEWARDARIAACGLQSFLFLDTETTGMAGGTGTYAFLVGIGRFAGDEFRLAQILMRDPIEEPATLALLRECLRPTDALVTFNGKAFDVPLLNARYITNGRDSPFPSLAHLDLLPLARRLWRERLESRALGSLEIHILGAQRTEDDLPSWLVPQVYFDYLRTGDARPLKRILYHNAMDVVAMAALLNHIAQMLADPFGFAVEHGLDVIALAKLYEHLGRLAEAAQLYERGLEYDLEEQVFRLTFQRLSLLQRRRGDLPAAVELWHKAAGSRQIYAFVELAKYYEHKTRDYALAAQWTQDALDVIAAPDSPVDLRKHWQAELEHRLERLRGRGKGKGSNKSTVDRPAQVPRGLQDRQ